MKIIKKGFTMAELMVCLAVIGVIAAITIPTMLNSRPNKNKAMFRKAYYLTERVVSELLNDETLYPDDDGNCSRDFAYDKKDDSNNYDTRYKVTKFVENFTDKINTSGEITRGTKTLNGMREIDANAPTFTTTDGITWYFNTENSDAFCDSAKDSYRSEAASCAANSRGVSGKNEIIQFAVDVNGENEPNAFDGEDPDRFVIEIKYNGKVSVPHAKPNGGTPSTEEEYLNSTKIM